METEISELRPLEATEAVVDYKLQMTMVDGKVTNVATNTTSSQKCSMCGVTPRQVNDLELVAGLPVTNLNYGLSSLHCWIRCFECLIHISYRLELEVCQVRAADKPRYQRRKRQVQAQLRETMGLRVDEPRASGSGNSNDGNTARRAFRDAADFAACTGIDERLIRDLHTVLQAVSCFHELRPDAMDEFCRRTAERYVALYRWYPMPPTLHKLLCHSAAVIASCLLPIGMMSEEAAESSNKKIREYRLQHTRKDTRDHTMSDLFGYLLVASDPSISSLGLKDRRDKTWHRGTLLASTLALLKAPELPEVEEPHGLASSQESQCSSDDE